jgi:L-fuculose-phosphate aldolase
MSEVGTLKQQLVEAILMLEKVGFVDFTGHLSARVPGKAQMLINSGSSVRCAITTADIVTIDFDGNLVSGEAKPPLEFHIHAAIYRRRPDVNSVVHGHPRWSTTLGSVGIRVQPVIAQAAVLGDIRMFLKTASINTRELGEELAETLGSERVAMLKSHGSVVAGASVVEAFVLACYLEETAERQYLALQIGTPNVLTPEEVDIAARKQWSPSLLQKVWDYHYAKLRRS